jgi:hypothetical protein
MAGRLVTRQIHQLLAMVLTQTYFGWRVRRTAQCMFRCESPSYFVGRRDIQKVTRGVVNGLWQYDVSQNIQRLQAYCHHITDVNSSTIVNDGIQTVCPSFRQHSTRLRCQTKTRTGILAAKQ